MRPVCFVLLILGIVAVSETALADSIKGDAVADPLIIYFVNEARPPVHLPFTTIRGVVAICEGPTSGNSCPGGLSDLVFFTPDPKNRFGTLVTMCSDAEPCPFAFTSANAKVFLPENPNEHIETVFYIASVTLPGSIAGRSLAYDFIGDTPKPSSLVLLGTGLVGFVPIFRRKLRM